MKATQSTHQQLQPKGVFILPSLQEFILDLVMNVDVDTNDKCYLIRVSPDVSSVTVDRVTSTCGT